MIYLKSMTSLSFDDFRKASESGYASSLAGVEEISFAEAMSCASTQFQALVPEGLATVDQSFFDVFEKQTNHVVGYLWLGVENQFGRKVATINDIFLRESYRGKGYGKALMKLVEQEAGKLGAKRIRLHVFYGNDTAKQLYLAMGFVPTNLYMRKELS